MRTTIRLTDSINAFAAYSGAKPSQIRKELASILWPDIPNERARVELHRMEKGRIPRDFMYKVHLICQALATDPNYLFDWNV